MRQPQHGAALLIFMAVVVMAAMAFLVSKLTPEMIEARRAQRTSEALAQAREALIGYALTYRDRKADRMFGYLPMPDIGKRGTTQDENCKDASDRPLEGCQAPPSPSDISKVDGNKYLPTLVGRFPWRTLGLPPLRDGHGECLWLIVSSLALNGNATETDYPFNWDTPGFFDIQLANGGNELQPLLTNKPHDRPWAIVYAPGPILSDQNRSENIAQGNDVTECKGNYDARNYLDPYILNALGGPRNSLANLNSASDDPTGFAERTNNPIKVTTNGKIFKSGGNFIANGCSGNDCNLITNDLGLVITSDAIFAAVRKRKDFRENINSMLSSIENCLNLRIQGWDTPGPTNQSPRPFDFLPLLDNSNTPQPLATPDGKIIGHLKDCFSDAESPIGYFTHYRDQVFLAGCDSGACIPTTVKKKMAEATNTTPPTYSTTSQNCPAVLVFSNQRSAAQSRTTALETFSNDAGSNVQVQQRNNPANYLEGINLDSFRTTGGNTFEGFSGDHEFWRVNDGQLVNQDIVRCLTGKTLELVAPQLATATGNIQLAQISPATGALMIGSAAIHSNYGASAANLYACAWTPETHLSGSGFRKYFRFRIRQVGEGFTFAVIDGDRNGSDVCGAARQHLGYSGNNGVTPYIQAPKLAIEFDTARNAGFTEPASLSNGRNDPCYQGSCGSAQNLDSNAHVAVVYWGYQTSHGSSPAVTQTLEDDNVHGFPWPSNFSWPQVYPWPPTAPTLPAASTRPAPHNPDVTMPFPSPAPDPAAGVAPLDRMGATSPAMTAPAQREFHARIEVTRSFTTPTDAKDGTTGIQIKLWIEPHSATNISAMTYNAGSPPTLSVTAAGHGFATGDIVVIKDAVPTGYNGEFPITRIDADHFTATLPNGTPDSGKYISYISWTDTSSATDLATVTSPNHGLNTGDTVNISGAIPAEYNGTRSVTVIDSNTYRFGLELSYEPGDMPPAIAAAKALTPRAIALANTTRPMSALDATFKPIITDSTTIYDEQTGACAASAPFCPSGQACGSDNFCYRPSLRNLRLGFTIGERATSSTSTARGQLIEINEQPPTWLE